MRTSATPSRSRDIGNRRDRHGRTDRCRASAFRSPPCRVGDTISQQGRTTLDTTVGTSDTSVASCPRRSGRSPEHLGRFTGNEGVDRRSRRNGERLQGGDAYGRGQSTGPSSGRSPLGDMYEPPANYGCGQDMTVSLTRCTVRSTKRQSTRRPGSPSPGRLAVDATNATRYSNFHFA